MNVLSSLCQQIDGLPLAGVVIVGDGQSARAIAMAGSSMKVPVLWAKGGTANLHSSDDDHNKVCVFYVCSTLIHIKHINDENIFHKVVFPYKFPEIRAILLRKTMFFVSIYV